MTHTDSLPYPTEQAFLRERDRVLRGIQQYDLAGVRMNLEASQAFADADVTQLDVSDTYDVWRVQ